VDAARLQAALRGGSALVVGLALADGAPYATRGWGLVTSCVDDRLVARVLVDALDRAQLEGLCGRRVVATTSTEVRSLRSVQLKGPLLAIEDATDDDLATVAAYKDDFFTAVLEIDDIGWDHMERMTPAAFVAVTCRVEEAYDQTPGPLAGQPVASGP
jgi:hypothetical protein